MIHVLLIKSDYASLEPWLLLNEVHSCVNVSEPVQGKHELSLAHYTLGICFNTTLGPSSSRWALLASLWHRQGLFVLICCALHSDNLFTSYLRTSAWFKENMVATESPGFWFIQGTFTELWPWSKCCRVTKTKVWTWEKLSLLRGGEEREDR